MTWYKKAASLGETPAMFKLGRKYNDFLMHILTLSVGMIQWKGLLGQPRNPRDGIIWLKRAADQADENNQHALHELVHFQFLTAVVCLTPLGITIRTSGRK